MPKSQTNEVIKLKQDLSSCEEKLKEVLEQEQRLLPFKRSVNKHIFISYSKKDGVFANKLANDLEIAGFRVWIDKRSIEIGDKWRETIEQNLKAAGEVIVVLSPNALNSAWVPYEGALAVGWDKPIFPLLIAEVASLPPWLDKYQYINFLNDPYESCLKSLLKKLTPPNPVQDLLEMQVFIHRKTGELIGEALLQVIDEANQSLIYSKEAKALLEASRDKILHERERIQALEQRARAAEEIRSTGTAVAALQHRVNNSLSLLLPNIHRLRSRIDKSDLETTEILDIIERNARQTSNLLARIQEPFQESRHQALDINVLLSNLAARYSKEKSLENISIKTKLTEEMPPFEGPSTQLSEAFHNLMSNAFQAMPQGGTLEIITQVEYPYIDIYFKDTGKGIPREIRESIFMKPVISKQSGGGAGLGLWFSNLVLQSVGGRIKIEKSDLSGTTMLVQLPIDRNTNQSGELE